MTEPFSIVLWGVTTSVLKNWLKGMESAAGAGADELMARQVPPASSTGRARVIKSADELDQLLEGEILVATTTSPSWAPAFTKIAGAVTDVGGAMCHAAIVCREYGLAHGRRHRTRHLGHQDGRPGAHRRRRGPCDDPGEGRNPAYGGSQPGGGSTRAPPALAAHTKMRWT